MRSRSVVLLTPVGDTGIPNGPNKFGRSGFDHRDETERKRYLWGYFQDRVRKDSEDRRLVLTTKWVHRDVPPRTEEDNLLYSLFVEESYRNQRHNRESEEVFNFKVSTFTLSVLKSL